MPPEVAALRKVVMVFELASTPKPKTLWSAELMPLMKTLPPPESTVAPDST
jgi:hypothetical protein